MKEQERVTLAYGSGGKLMHQLVNDLFKKKFSNKILDELTDSALIEKSSSNDFVFCFTTDSYTVSPLFFPGGDIGKLSICGTINDLAVMGAKPLYISTGFIIEEGLEYRILERITSSMKKVIEKEKVKIVTGDIKVVEKGNADKLFINTSGIGIRNKKFSISRKSIKPGDKVIINGCIGEHEISVLSAREGFDFKTKIVSDCASLWDLVINMLEVCPHIRFMRDPTRGGVGTTLNEIVDGMDFGILIKEDFLPIKKEVKGICEVLGFDPLYLANEGKMVAIVSKDNAERVLKQMRRNPLGKDSCIIGEIVKSPKGRVILETHIGAHRIVDMLTGQQLPRIC